eukprot:3893219-Pyramimonas_sp.AAC.1
MERQPHDAAGHLPAGTAVVHEGAASAASLGAPGEQPGHPKQSEQQPRKGQKRGAVIEAPLSADHGAGSTRPFQAEVKRGDVQLTARPLREYAREILGATRLLLGQEQGAPPFALALDPKGYLRDFLGVLGSGAVVLANREAQLAQEAEGLEDAPHLQEQGRAIGCKDPLAIGCVFDAVGVLRAHGEAPRGRDWGPLRRAAH